MAQGLWIELHPEVWTHPKTYELARLLRVDPMLAAAHTIRLWTWAIEAAANGSLGHLPPEEIAAGAGWRKRAGAFVEALIAAKWIDGDTMELHDWLEYTVALRESQETKRAKAAERVRNYRERKRAEKCNALQNVTGNASVTPLQSPPCNPPPYLTVPNHTKETDGERAREELPTGDIDVDGPDIVSLDIVRVSDAAAKLGFPVDCITIDPNVEFCVETYGAAETTEALEKTASIIASGRSIGDRWEYAKGILRKTRANGTNAPPGGTGPPASRGYFVLTESGKEYELGKDDFDEELRRYTLRNDLEVERLEPNRIAVRGLAHVEQ